MIGRDRGAAEPPSDRHLDRRRQYRGSLHGIRRAAPSYLPTRPGSDNHPFLDAEADPQW